MRPARALALAVLSLFLARLAPLAAQEEEAAPGPRLAFDREEHHFGRAAQGEELYVEMGYRNAGDEPVTGIRAKGDCGCYGVTLSRDRLEPGEEGVLGVTFRTLLFSGTVRKRLTVTTESEPRQMIRIPLVVDVIGGVVLDPGRAWFGDVLVGTRPSKAVVAKWHAEAGREFAVAAVEIPGHDFAVDLDPYASADGTWRGTRITLTFREPPPLGIFSATALIRTDHPDYPRISLALTANVSGKVWVQSRTVYFGWVRRGDSKRTTIRVRPFAPEIDLGEVTVRAREGRVEVGVEKDPYGREGWWQVTVGVSPEAEPGPLDDVVEIHSAVPGEEVTEIRVRGEVLALGR